MYTESYIIFVSSILYNNQDHNILLIFNTLYHGLYYASMHLFIYIYHIYCLVDQDSSLPMGALVGGCRNGAFLSLANHLH